MASRVLVAALASLCSAIAPACGNAATSSERTTPPQYRLSVMSWWEIPFRSVVHQQYDFSCGSAAVATLLTYHYARPTRERTVFSKMWQDGDQKTIRKSGFSMLDMKAFLSSIGLRAEGLRLGRDGLERLKRPAIVLLNVNGFKHFVVVKGVMNGLVLVGDPMRGIRRLDEGDFLKAWNGIGLVILDSDLKPQFNRVSEWLPWSTAPLGEGASNIAADNYLAHLPPAYQLAPIIFIDAHVGTVPWDDRCTGLPWSCGRRSRRIGRRTPSCSSAP